MVVTLLGTGTSSGVPLIGCDCEVCRSLDYRDKRLRVSIHVEINDKSFVIDTGPDFRQQMLREQINRIDALLFTHQHKDHIAGLDDIRAYNFKQKTEIPIFGRREVLNQIETEFAYIFASHKYPGIPSVTLHEIVNEPFMIDNIPFTPIDVWHHKMPVFGFRIGNFAYLTDVNRIPEDEIPKLLGLDVLILGALQQEPHISHFSLSQALEVVEMLQPKQTYFTHISHRLGTHRAVEKTLPNHIKLGYDGLKIFVK